LSNISDKNRKIQTTSKIKEKKLIDKNLLFEKNHKIRCE